MVLFERNETVSLAVLNPPSNPFLCPSTFLPFLCPSIILRFCPSASLLQTRSSSLMAFFAEKIM